MTTAEGYKKEIKALEEKCQSITNSLSKYRIETESSKQVLDLFIFNFITIMNWQYQ